MNINELNCLIGKSIFLHTECSHFDMIASGDLRINKYGRYSIDIKMTPITFTFASEDVEKIKENNIFIKK